MYAYPLHSALIFSKRLFLSPFNLECKDAPHPIRPSFALRAYPSSPSVPNAALASSSLAPSEPHQSDSKRLRQVQRTQRTMKRVSFCWPVLMVLEVLVEEKWGRRILRTRRKDVNI